MMFHFDLMETMPLVQGTKICRDCKEQKLFSDFYRHRLGRLQSYCKQCDGNRRRLWEQSNPEKKAAYNKRYYSTERGRMMNSKSSMASQARHPNEVRSRGELWLARKRGEIAPTPCMVCGNEKIEGHHYLGYALKHALHVQWLCHKHHRIADGRAVMRYPSYNAMLADIRIGIAFQAKAQSNPLLSLMELPAWAHATALEMTKHYRPEGWKETH